MLQGPQCMLGYTVTHRLFRRSFKGVSDPATNSQASLLFLKNLVESPSAPATPSKPAPCGLLLQVQGLGGSFGP